MSPDEDEEPPKPKDASEADAPAQAEDEPAIDPADEPRPHDPALVMAVLEAEIAPKLDEAINPKSDEPDLPRPFDPAHAIKDEDETPAPPVRGLATELNELPAETVAAVSADEAPEPIPAASEAAAAEESEAPPPSLEHGEVLTASEAEDHATHKELAADEDTFFAPKTLPNSAHPRAVRGRSLFDDAVRRLRRNRAAVASLITLAALTLLALLGPALWIYKVDQIFRDRVAAPPSFDHWHLLGTDTEGHDMVARILFGLGVSLLVGVAATAVALTIGLTWGAIAGFFGGAVDTIMMRAVDAIYAVPFFFFVLVLMTVVQTREPVANLLLIFAAIGAVEWLTMARIVRGQTIAIRRKEFVEAARAAGAGPFAILARHIIPNLLGPILVFATLNVPIIILAESFLSFLGLGIQPPLTSLGALIAKGASEMRSASWVLIAPAFTMLLTLLSLNFLGDGLRDAFDPKER